MHLYLLLEQFVLRGGRALVFVDPYVEAQSITARSGRELGRDNINLLLGNWGVVMAPDKIAADVDDGRPYEDDHQSGENEQNHHDGELW